MSHYRILCTECEAVMAQCRCPAENKETRYMICDECVFGEDPSPNYTNLREELIQVAAVAVAIVEDLDSGSTALLRGPGGLSEAHQQVRADVMKERIRQEQKWGERNNVPIAKWLVILGEEYGEACKAALDDLILPKE